MFENDFSVPTNLIGPTISFNPFDFQQQELISYNDVLKYSKKLVKIITN